MFRRATASDDVARAYQIRQVLEVIHGITSEEVDTLTTRYGALDALSPQDIRAMRRPPPRVGPTTSATLPATVRPPATVPSTTAPPPGRLDVHIREYPIVLAANPAFPELRPAG